MDCLFQEVLFLACQIKIAEILPWDRNSYLTHAILPMLSHEGFTLVVLELTHMVVKCHHCYVIVTSSCHVTSQGIQEFLGAF